MHGRTTSALAATMLAAVAAIGVGGTAAADPNGTVPVRLLALNDFHGNLLPRRATPGS